MQRKPITETVLQKLEELIRINLSINEYQLPPVHELCTLLAASHYTIWRVLDLLRKRGDLTVKGKRWVLSNKATTEQAWDIPVPMGQIDTHPKWKTVCRTIKTDINNGVYAHNRQIPGIKQLSGIYGANRKTIQKAMNELARVSWLIRDGLRYKIPPLPKLYAQTVVLLASGSAQGWLHLFSERSPDLLRAHINVCGEKGLRLKVVTCEFDGLLYSDGAKIELDQVLGHDSILGTIFWPLSIAESKAKELAAQIKASGKPLSIYDEGSGITFAESIRESNNVELFTSNDFQAGQIVGQYLEKIGHKQISYISPFQGAFWSEARLAGLRQITRSSGLEIDILSCKDTPAIRESRPGIYEKLSNIIDEETRNGTFNDLHTAQLLGLYKEIDAAGDSEFIQPQYTRLMDAALNNRKSTAWVVANDNIAIKCLRYLKEKRINVPGEISVIGFDDCLEGLYAQLSSYNFHSTAITYAMVNALTRSDRFSIRARTGEYYSVKGFIDERNSCGPAPVRD